MIIKGRMENVNYGDFDHSANLIPVAVSLNNEYKSPYFSATVTYKFKDNKLINLSTNNIRDIDFASFNTSIEDELIKAGFDPEDGQLVGDKLFFTRQKDGTRKPIKKYQVKFIYANEPKTGDISESDYIVGEVIADSELEAIKECTNWVKNKNWIQNVVCKQIV